MSRVTHLAICGSALLVAAFAVACSSPATVVGVSQPSASSLAAPAAYLIYPTSAPALAPGQTPPPVGQGYAPDTLIFAVSGTPSASYQVLVSPTPPSLANPSPCPTTSCGSSTPAWTVTVNPSALPYLYSTALPSPSPGYSYVVAQGPPLQSVTSYVVSLASCASAIAACSSPQPIMTTTLQTGCQATPPPYAVLVVTMLSPSNGAANVADGTGSLLLGGSLSTAFGTATLSLSSASGAAVQLGAPTAAPTPLPSPLPTNFPASELFTVSMPPLSSATTYTLSETYIDYLGQAPICWGPHTVTVGTFTTQ